MIPAHDSSGEIIGIARHSKSRAPIEELTSVRITP